MCLLLLQYHYSRLFSGKSKEIYVNQPMRTHTSIIIFVCLSASKLSWMTFILMYPFQFSSIKFNPNFSLYLADLLLLCPTVRDLVLTTHHPCICSTLINMCPYSFQSNHLYPNLLISSFFLHRLQWGSVIHL